MRTLSWFSRRYPTADDLLVSIEGLGAVVLKAPIGTGALFVAGEGSMPPAIILPQSVGQLRLVWLMAHELGHLVLHGGYVSRWTHDRQEAAADRWAARALVPESAVRRHRNASVDAFIGALSSHYEDIPLYDCPERRLAAEIATIRLKAVEEVA